MKERQTRAFPAHFEAREENNEMTIEGYFAVFNSEYELWPGAAETIAPGAFSGTLDRDIRALCDHNPRLVLGRTKAGTLELKENEKGLWGRIKLNPNDQDAMNLRARVLRGDVDQCSFGFDIEDEGVEQQAGGGRTLWTIRKVTLYEVSVVTFPAYEETAVQARQKELGEIHRRELELWKNQMQARLKGEHHGA